MKRVIFSLLCLVAMFSQAVAAPPSSSPAPAKVVDEFYGKYLKLKVSGLPDAKQSEAIKPFLSEGLNKLLVAAKRKQADEIKRNPDDKPSWGDGDLFSSLFEGAQRYKADAAVVSGKTATVPVHLEYGEHKSLTRWTDTFVLTLENDAWKISDVKMGGQWQFKQGASLRSVLAEK